MDIYGLFLWFFYGFPMEPIIQMFHSCSKPPTSSCCLKPQVLMLWLLSVPKICSSSWIIFEKPSSDETVSPLVMWPWENSHWNNRYIIELSMDLNGPSQSVYYRTVNPNVWIVFVSPHLCPSNALYTDISAAIIGILGLTGARWGRCSAFGCQWGSLGFKVTLGLQESFGICLFDLAKSEKSGVSSLETIYIYHMAGTWACIL